MTYEEWKHAKGDELFFKSARNVNRDMDMHDEYSDLYKQHKEAFSKAVPKNFNDFQNLKYNNTDEWNQMVSDARTARLYDKKPQLYSQKIAAKNAAKAVDNKDGSGIIKTDERFDIADSKITKFLLSPGAKHSKEFFDVGYLQNDHQKLYNDISNEFDISKAFDKKEISGNQRFSIYMQLGVNEKKQFRTVWEIDPETKKPRFITAHREG